MDAFYASIEIRDNPKLKGLPVVVGGSPQSRAVVCTASYEARKFGIRSAMACSKAARLCPRAIFMPPDFEKYYKVSQQIRDIFKRYTDLIEPVSLDEAYLDVTNNKTGQFAVQIARQIQLDIFNELKLTGSAGVAPNKLVAKIASDLKKPAGLTIILPEQVASFMSTMPLRKINGVGPVTENRLKEAGFNTCADILKCNLSDLIAALGPSTAPWLYDAAQGLDDRPVEISHERKSLGREDTFAQDTVEFPTLFHEMAKLSQSVSHDLKDEELKGKTITLKVKYGDFEQVTRSITLAEATDDAEILFESCRELLEKTDAGKRPIRLLGISLSKLEHLQNNSVRETRLL